MSGPAGKGKGSMDQILDNSTKKGKGEMDQILDNAAKKEANGMIEEKD